MKKLLFLGILFLSQSLFAQIPYGSNNGKYLNIRGAKVYYEEYGKGTPLLLLHGEFGSLLKGDVGAEFLEIIPGENTAIVLAEGRMQGVGGTYENEYALKYVLNDEGKVTILKEYLSDLLLAQKLYGQDLCGEKMNFN